MEEKCSKNTNLSDLNMILFQELDRLNNDETLKKTENLDNEIKRSKAITDIAQTIIKNANTILDAKKYSDSCGFSSGEIPKMLSVSDAEK